MKHTFAYLVICTLLFLTFFFQSLLLKNRFTYSFTNPLCSWCNEGETDEIVYIPADTIFIRLLAPADPNFIADLLWLRACYYVGVHAVTDQEYFDLYYLLNRITDLSPQWESPYLSGATLLYLEAKRPSHALALLEKGISHHKNSWELLLIKGYILWEDQGNYEAASKTLFKASQIKGAPQYFSSLLVTLAQRTDNQAFRHAFFKTVMETLKDPLQKQIIQKKISGEKAD